MLDIDGFYFKGYKSFSDAAGVKINQIKNINLVIGKNNSGKSSFIDVISYLYNQEKYRNNSRRIESLVIKKVVSYEEIETAYDNQVPSNIYQFTNKTLSINIINKLNGDKQFKFVDGIFASYGYTPEVQSIINLCIDKLSLLKDYTFIRVASERDIIPEKRLSGAIKVDENGNGATGLINHYLNVAQRDEKEIEEKLLNALNMIMYPDAKFIRIYSQADNNYDTWEIYLEEKNSLGRFPLSQTGSGLKTVILILLNLITLPNISKIGLDKYIFAFEEIENNLHPALQRRIFEYLYNFAVENDTHIFVTTHSHVAINTYRGKENAQIIHVTKDTTCDTSSINVIDNHIDKINILDDLDVRASDLFQSNGIIWVEGPSDRIYIKKWIEIFSNEEFLEGNHYQFLYYGGKLLSHYGVDGNAEEVIEILKVNRNAVIIIDSDKKTRNARINSTKRRVRDECANLGIQCWITQGKEIENYLPKGAINSSFNAANLEQCEQYELFPSYIKSVDSTFSNHKVSFANKIVENITKETSEDILDLEAQINKIINNIKKWNPEL